MRTGLTSKVPIDMTCRDISNGKWREDLSARYLHSPRDFCSRGKTSQRIRLNSRTLFLIFSATTLASISLCRITVTAFQKGSPVFSPRREGLYQPTNQQERYFYPCPRQQSKGSIQLIPASTLLMAKKDDKSDDDSDDSLSRLSLSGFFSRDSSKKDSEMDKDEDTDESSSSIPLIGRFFGGKGDKDEEDDDEEKSPSRVRSALSRYFQTRRIRKDAEALREEVLRREEENRIRIKEQQKRVADARKQVQSATGLVQRESRQEQVKQEVEKLRRIEAQKVVDLKRLERLEKVRLEQELRQKGIPPSEAGKAKMPVSSAALRQSPTSSSPSAPIKPAPKQKEQKKDNNKGKSEDETSSSSGLNVVSVAQKFVMGLLDKEEEEWIVVAPKTRISPGELVPITVAGIDLLLVASKDGSALHCIANSCPHLGTPLEIGTLERRPIQSLSDGDGTSFGSQGTGEGQGGGVPFFQENDISRMLKEDGCEECIVCPLHRTAFALESGEVRGEWCPYPPVIGKLTGAIKKEANLPVFDVRTRGKNIEVRLNTPVIIESDENQKKKKKKD
jgi:nitrite reductase/ring-hydroxylating ferredoxin subunit